MSKDKISEHIFALSGGYCVYHSSNLFCNVRSFENWGIFSNIPQFQVGNIRSHDVFRSVAREQEYLMNYKHLYYNQHSILLL